MEKVRIGDNEWVWCSIFNAETSNLNCKECREKNLENLLCFYGRKIGVKPLTFRIFLSFREIYERKFKG